MTRRTIGLILAIWFTAVGGRPALVQVDARLLSCESAFAQEASATSLAEYFGPANVTNADIDVGEGQTEPGTVLFAESSEDRLDILWKDEKEQRQPRAIFVRNPSISAPKVAGAVPGGSRWGLTSAGLSS